MTPAAEALVRSIVQLGLTSGSMEGRMLAQLAANALTAEGVAPEPLPEIPIRPAPRTNAERVAAHRDRKRQEAARAAGPPESVTGVTRNVTGNAGGEGGGLSDGSDEENEETLDPPTGGSGGDVTDGNVTSVTRMRRGGAPANVTADGAFGDSVSAWFAGVNEVTRLSPMTLGEQRKLVGVLTTHGPKGNPGALLSWAQAKGAEYAKSCQASGATLSVFDFGRYADSGFRHRGRAGDANGANEPGSNRDVLRGADRLVAQQAAQAADDEQARRARTAGRRQPSGPSVLGTPPAGPRTPPDLEAERARQRRAAADFDETRPPARKE